MYMYNRSYRRGHACMQTHTYTRAHTQAYTCAHTHTIQSDDIRVSNQESRSLTPHP